MKADRMHESSGTVSGKLRVSTSACLCERYNEESPNAPCWACFATSNIFGRVVLYFWTHGTEAKGGQ